MYKKLLFSQKTGGNFRNFGRKKGNTMEIEYRQTKELSPEALGRLFRSVNWESGDYPERLARAMRNSEHVITAWDGERLVGLVRALDDGETVAFVHYLLVDPCYQGCHIGDTLMKMLMQRLTGRLYVKVMPSDPESMGFYARYGFREYENYSAMVRKNFPESWK